MRLCKAAMDVLWHRADCKDGLATTCPACKSDGLRRLPGPAGTTYVEGDSQWVRTGRCRDCKATVRLNVRTTVAPEMPDAYEHAETLSIEVTE